MDDYSGQLDGYLFQDEVQYQMVDYNDIVPFKNMFSLIGSTLKHH